MTQEAKAQRLADRQVASRDSGADQARSQIGVPLSFAQERLWFLNELESGNTAYNIPLAFRLSGPLDIPALRLALVTMLRRHASLRTRFVVRNGKPLQVVAPDIALEIPIVDLREMRKGALDAEIQNCLRREVQHRFDLEHGPLFRVTLISLPGPNFVFVMNMHHIVTDGWSIGVLLREISTCYEAFRQGREPTLPPLLMQYVDVAQIERSRLEGPRLERLSSYWRTQLSGAPKVLALSTGQSRLAVRSGRGGTFEFELPEGLCESVRQRCREVGVTPFMFLLSAFCILLSARTREHDIVVGSPVANRSSTAVEALVGLFVNIVVLRLHIDQRSTVDTFLRQTKDTSLGAYSHQEMPFEKLVELLRIPRSLSYHPVYQVAFGFRNPVKESLRLDGVTGSRVSLEQTSSQVDLGLFFSDTGAGFRGALEFSSDLFDRSTAATLAMDYEATLSEIVARPQATIESLDSWRCCTAPNAPPRGDMSTGDGPEHPAGGQTELPSTATERLVADIWKGLLGLNVVGTEDNFFDIGGHSLLAAEVIANLESSLRCRISLRALFEAPTLRAFAASIDQSLQEDRMALPPIMRREKPVERVPLSHAQESLWILHQIDPSSAAYNVPFGFQLAGELNLSALRRSVKAVVQRHESLRTTFPSRGGEPVQLVSERAPVDIQLTDVCSLPVAARKLEVERIVQDEITCPFSLEAAPLLRFRLIQTSSQECVFLANMHHIITDGWSIAILLRELGEAYVALSRNEGVWSPPPLPIQYADYAAWQRSSQWARFADARLRYWKNALKDCPKLSSFRADRERPRVLGGTGRVVVEALSENTSERVNALSKVLNATAFITYLAIFRLVLLSEAGLQDAVVAAPVAGRGPEALKNLIGYFVNTVAIRLPATPDQTFAQFLQIVRERVIDAYENEAPFELVMRSVSHQRSRSHHPLYQVMFALDQFELQLDMGSGLRADVLSLLPFWQTTKCDLIFVVEPGRRSRLVINYSTELFTEATVRRIANTFRKLAERITEDPAVPIRALLER